MGVFEEGTSCTPGMHWQHEHFIGPAYDPSRDLSPNLPSCESSMGDVDASISSSSSCSTPSNNNNQQAPCASEVCRPHQQPQHHHHHHHHHQHQQCRRSHDCSSTAASQGQPDGDDDFCPPNFEHQIPKLEPLQTPRTPPTPPPGGPGGGNPGDQDAICAGCGARITDRFYLQAVDRRWHAACLQCCQCRNTLDGEITCFSRDGNIYCKKDYYRLFGMKRCGRCQATILSSELVMRARESVFHVHCFSCVVCNAPLTKGDHFGMRDGAVLCRLHFEMSLASEPHPAAVAAAVAAAAIYGGGTPNSVYPQGPFGSPDFHPHHHHHHHHHHPPLPPPTPVDATTVAKVPFPSPYNGATPTPRQKGRPRKRKPKDLEAMTASLDINSDYLDMPFGRSPGTPGMPGSNQRTKRMRTSFKHHQLRTMKSYFAINHNPDAKDLKQLSQKTGLPKRVLQVWFQNARAKWRRMMLKQEGKGGDKSGESMSDMDIYPGPGSIGGSIQSLNPHSPPFLMNPNSPSSSLDCS
ncbi:LIM/homeobox protein Lhx9 isoform X2 [Onthophagus taurus]|uniref:LIM/homeobox protein Lhx9 isoform X2 n=1 Tax=Onthophagus taurus TaxID=166361 RepID=UPI0039BDACF0